MIAISADFHSNQFRLAGTIQDLRDRCPRGDRFLLCCGDWGFLIKNDYGEQRFLDDLEAQSDITFIFLDGNHENHSALNALPIQQWMGGQVHALRRNVLHLMRGNLFTIEGRRFFVFGGGATREQDRQRRQTIREETGIECWWPEEIPSPQEMDHGWETLRAAEFAVDFIVSHTGPGDVLRKMGVSPLLEEVDFAAYLDEVRNTVAFDRWFFGHLHRDWQWGPFTCIRYNTVFL